MAFGEADVVAGFAYSLIIGVPLQTAPAYLATGYTAVITLTSYTAMQAITQSKFQRNNNAAAAVAVRRAGLSHPWRRIFHLFSTLWYVGLGAFLNLPLLFMQRSLESPEVNEADWITLPLRKLGVWAPALYAHRSYDDYLEENGIRSLGSLRTFALAILAVVLYLADGWLAAVINYYVMFAVVLPLLFLRLPAALSGVRPFE